MVVQEALREFARLARYGWCVLSNPRAYAYHGVILPLRATPDLQRTRRRIYRGVYEAPEIAALTALIEPDDRVLELGGGCGIVSAVIAARLSDSRNLCVLEANPRLMPSIRAVAAANSLRHEVVEAAVGETEGEGDFYFDDNFLKSSALDRGRDLEAVKVRFVALASLLARRKPTVLFADVEGAELRLLQAPLPSCVRLVCLELHPHVIGDAGVSDICRRLLDQGFDLLVDHCLGRTFTFRRATSAGHEWKGAAGEGADPAALPA